MHFHQLIPVISVSFYFFAAQVTGALPSSNAPNIVVILADDLGYGDVKCYNPERGKIPTPHLDELAAAGLRFTDAHSSSAVCSPTRYSLLTGRYHWRTRLQSGIVNTFGPPLVAADRMTLADLLKAHGYRTACIGKWHLGWSWPIPADRRDQFMAGPSSEGAPPSQAQREMWREAFSQPIGGGPLDCGFDYFFGVDLPNYPPFCFLENDRTVGIPSEFLSAALLKDNLGIINGPALPDWQFEPVLPELAAQACRFIREAAAEQRPFFLYLPLTSPHTPLAVSPAWKGKSGINSYADFVMQTDDIVGQVLTAIESTGAAENTLVVFTSDNGCAPYIRMDKLIEHGHYPSGPWRGNKSDVWEGGHRVPFIVRWPAVVAAGGVNDQLVQQADLFATIAEIVGAKLPADAGEDSFSFLSLLEGEKAGPRESAVNQSLHGLLAIRKGPWKLIFGSGSGGWSTGGEEQPQQLYNLTADPAETKNLFADEPAVVAELTVSMERTVNAGRSRPGPAQRNDVPVKWRRFIAAAKQP